VTCSSLARGYPFCYSSAPVCTRAVLVTVAGLIGFFSAWLGQTSPPVVRSVPLRGLSLGLHSQQVRASYPLLVDVLIEKTKEKNCFMVFRQVLESVLS
jgi:hypothetical protein